mgnify:CR=1 FL=1
MKCKLKIRIGTAIEAISFNRSIMKCKYICLHHQGHQLNRFNRSIMKGKLNNEAGGIAVLTRFNRSIMKCR